MNAPQGKTLGARRPSELLKRGYADEEVNNIYELGRLFIENGDWRRAKTIFDGLTAIAEDFAPAWLGSVFVQVMQKDFDEAIKSSQRALKLDPTSLEAMLFLVVAYMGAGDYNSAGTYLGEVAEGIQNPNVAPDTGRFFKAQLARYQNRNK